MIKLPACCALFVFLVSLADTRASFAQSMDQSTRALACRRWTEDKGVQDQCIKNSKAEGLFQSHCSVCHEHGVSSAPSRHTLAKLPSTFIYNALTNGKMKAQAARLSEGERLQIAEYLSETDLGADASHPLVLCKNDALWFDRRKRPVGVGWGSDFENTRLVSKAQAGLSSHDVTRLTLRWVLTLPGGSLTQPLIAGGGLFAGSPDGSFYALDAASGCVHWTFQADALVGNAAVILFDDRLKSTGGVPASTLFFGDMLANVYAVDARTGKVLWKVKVDDQPGASIRGAPLLLENRLYVPVSVPEERFAGPDYSCCTARGVVVALDAATGEFTWKRYTIPSPAVEQSKNSAGKPQYGPSGASVWSSLAADRARGALYFTTGNNFSDPADENSDAIFALNLANGEVKWRTQTIADDAWTTWGDLCGANTAQPHADCPGLKRVGPDIDFTAPPILIKGRHSKDILVAGRKDGAVFGLDPNNGRILWCTGCSDSISYGNALYYGMMAEGSKIIAPSIALKGPYPMSLDPSSDGGLYALDAQSGKRLWFSRVSSDCPKNLLCAGIENPPIGFEGVAFAGSIDGYVRAYDTRSGNVLWRFDTAQEFTAINGDRAKGGGIRNGIMIANGMVYVSSGDVLFAFSSAKGH